MKYRNIEIQNYRNTKTYLLAEMRASNIYRKDLGREGSSANYTLNKTTEEEKN